MSCSRQSSRTCAASLRISSSSGSDSPNPRAISSGARDRSSAVRADRGDDDQDAVLRQVPAVAERDVTHVPHSQAVDEGDPVSTRVDDSRPALVQLDHAPFSASTIESAGTPPSRASWACAASMRNSPWTGITAFGRTSAEDRPQLLGVAVARDVHRCDLLVQDLGAGLRKPVDRVVHAELVSGHRLRGEDHSVAALDAHRRMVVVRDPRQRRHRLALAARAEDHRLVRRELLDSFGRMNVSSGASR